MLYFLASNLYVYLEFFGWMYVYCLLVQSQGINTQGSNTQGNNTQESITQQGNNTQGNITQQGNNTPGVIHNRELIHNKIKIIRAQIHKIKQDQGQINIRDVVGV